MKRSLCVLFCLLFCGLSACGQLTEHVDSPPPATTTATTTTTTNPYPPVTSPVDFNQNGVDDSTDILLGARKDAENRPRYDGSYCDGGYPPDDAGVCTDVIWRAFKNAGYDLKAMIDKDIAAHTALYPRVEGRPDRNIDFRRVPNLRVFFGRCAQSLTTDTTQPEQWQPGDIVTYDFQNGLLHCAIVSDKRGAGGLPYILHNAGQYNREEDALAAWEITGHYRFDASKLDPDMRVAFAQ